MNFDEFYPPPEAPVFEPNEEEFADPLAYISKIKPIAEKTGICKIRPPPHWQPPFAIDVENFEFGPRTQRLNELGVHTRIRLQFVEKIAKYWELQGTLFRLPNVGGSALDLYGLHCTVKKFGGFAEVCSKRLWNTVCEKMKLHKNSSNQLKLHYEKILYPFDIMQSGILTDGIDDKKILLPGYLGKMKGKVNPCKAEADGIKRAKRRPVDSSLASVDLSNNKELQKLQLFGAGPKMVGLGLIAKENNRLRKLSQENAEKKANNIKTEDVKPQTSASESYNNGTGTIKQEPGIVKTEDTKKEVKINTRKKGSEQIPYSIIDGMDNCKACNKDDNDAQLLICEGCDDNYHTYCLVPPLMVVPKGDWRCPKCIQKECNKKTEAYGFTHAGKKYTLQSFGEMADSFKSEYFTKPVHMVPTDVVEKEFWRLIGSLDEDVSVEYGADIHVLEHGSGFPRMVDKETRELTAEEEEYATSSWNLNNLPVLCQSLLKSMSGDISGMKCPWTYVGMCFSAFCFHIEDHWTYSINYLHWGEPKTWYGVPRSDADKLEEVMKSAAPEMFANHPDLMHHLVTTINPATLMNNGVNVVRTNQCAGEFVITFPRAYHAGFNQGYNFAEAVNFCPADWVPIGRSCISNYRKVKRPCVFSHNEVICKVAGNPENLDVQLAAAVYRDMLEMVKEEKEHRHSVSELGVVESERVAFELDPDDERQCCVCKTTCFLSGIVCTCKPERLSCLYHAKELCSICPPNKFTLRYRYTLDELLPMVQRIKNRAESFDTWSENVSNALRSKDHKLSIDEFKDFIAEARENKFPNNDLMHQLMSAVREGERCAKVAQQLVSLRKHRTRQKDTMQGGCSLTLNEIKAFHAQLLRLPCQIPQSKHVSDYINKVEEFLKEAEIILREEDATSEVILDLIGKSQDFDLDIPQIQLLQNAAEQAKWLEDVRESLMLDDEEDEDMDECKKKYPLITLEQLRQLIENGASITPRPAVEKALAELQELLNRSEAWEERASQYFDSNEKGDFVTAQAISEESLQVPVELPNCEKLQDAVTKAKLWTNKLQVVQSQDYYPYISIIEAMLLQASPICIQLKQVAMIETQAAAARAWVEKTSMSFLKKNSMFTLLDVLGPRCESLLTCKTVKALKKRMKDQQTEEQTFIEKMAKTINIDTILNPTDPADVVKKFKSSESDELQLLIDLRTKNEIKAAAVSSSSDDNSITKENGDDQNSMYCICNKPSGGLMLQCELCHDWFHNQCVSIPKLNATNKSKVQQMFEMKFLCPLCQRSRRPKLETILSLLLQLQKLPVRIKEGEALQCLTERAMMWQEKARHILALPMYAELQSILDEKMQEHEALWQEHYNACENPSEVAKPIAPRRLSSLESIDDTISNVIRKSVSLYGNDKDSDDTDSMDTSTIPVPESAESPPASTTNEEMEAAEVLAMIASNHQTQPQDSAADDVNQTKSTLSNGHKVKGNN